MSKNNPENRGEITEMRKHNNKNVEPILYINGSKRFMAGVYENTPQLVVDASGKVIPYKNI